MQYTVIVFKSDPDEAPESSNEKPIAVLVAVPCGRDDGDVRGELTDSMASYLEQYPETSLEEAVNGVMEASGLAYALPVPVHEITA